eukprot:1138547-Pelagomonas_calceolata.AAC.16
MPAAAGEGPTAGTDQQRVAWTRSASLGQEGGKEAMAIEWGLVELHPREHCPGLCPHWGGRAHALYADLAGAFDFAFSFAAALFVPPCLPAAAAEPPGAV